MNTEIEKATVIKNGNTNIVTIESGQGEIRKDNSQNELWEGICQMFFKLRKAPVRTRKYIETLKVQYKIVPADTKMYTEEQMIQCYKDAVNKVGESFGTGKKLQSAEEYVKSL